MRVQQGVLLRHALQRSGFPRRGVTQKAPALQAAGAAHGQAAGGAGGGARQEPARG